MENIDFLNIQQIYYWIYLLIKNFFYYLNPIRWADIYIEYWPLLMLVSLFISAVLAVGLFYLRQKMKIVLKKDAEVFDTIISPTVEEKGQPIRNKRWERILEYINSASPSEWRLAILDADVVLDEMMDKAGYRGEGLGEKLKQVEKSDFNTINNAWEAHKIRNMIAHEGSDVILTKRTAKKAIDLYRQVFEEFKYI
ncbi:MAG: hypothetical protein KAV41_00285 [Candidatus Pacebacteria bacterium]|nr:hypothetical protein [Candidatus Paceibacterota bacterium]